MDLASNFTSNLQLLEISKLRTRVIKMIKNMTMTKLPTRWATTLMWLMTHPVRPKTRSMVIRGPHLGF